MQREDASGEEPGRMAYEEKWELTWEGHGMDMRQIWVPGTLGKSGSQSAHVHNELV